jgi:hypothetical protein
MRIGAMRPLFAWECLEDQPSLRTVKEFLLSVPDGELLGALERGRGRGRNDYPVRALWGTLLLQALLRHPTTEACLGELRRNAGLRRLIGIETEAGVPKKWNMSRFLEVLGGEPYLGLLRGVFDTMIVRLAGAVGDLGRHVSGDASHLSGRRSASEEAGDLPEATGGRKEYLDEAGTVTKVVEWFGYKLHALVDTKHEVALAYRVGPANGGDNETLPALVEEGLGNLPAGRMKTLAYDMAADDAATHAMLAERGVRPVIETRSLWKSEPERVLPGHDGRSKIVYDESGTVYCYDTSGAAAVRHRMAYIGYEAERGTLKYRCPARHEGWACPQEAECNGTKKYGRTVRVPCEIDLRRFPPIPRATKTFERLYRGRTTVERFNARLKVYWGADDGNIAGARRFHAFVGAIMVVHAGMATLLASAPRREGTLGKMRLGPLAEALREKWKR